MEKNKNKAGVGVRNAGVDVFDERASLRKCKGH